MAKAARDFTDSDIHEILGFPDADSQKLADVRDALFLLASAPVHNLDDIAWAATRLFIAVDEQWGFERALNNAFKLCGVAADIEMVIARAEKCGWLIFEHAAGREWPHRPELRITAWGEEQVGAEPPWVIRQMVTAPLPIPDATGESPGVIIPQPLPAQLEPTRQLPKKLRLNGFKEICEFVGLEYSVENQRRLSNLSKKTNGPLHSTGKGKRPKFVNAELVAEWFNAQEDAYAQKQADASRAEADACASTASPMNISTRKDMERGVTQQRIHDLDASTPQKRHKQT